MGAMTGLGQAEKRAMLARHFLLQALPNEALDRLAQLASIKNVAARGVVFQKGDASSGMMTVIRGRVRIGVTSSDGKEIVLNTIGPGQVFGEIALLDGKPRTADATAIEDTQLLTLSQGSFIPFIETNPQLCTRVIALLCERLRRTSEQLEENLILGLRQRLAKLLLRLAEANGAENGVKISQVEIAALLSVSREYVNRHLNGMKDEGLIDVRRGVIVVRDKPSLAAIADAE